MVTGKMADHNTFENPEVVKEAEFKDYSKTDNGIKFTIPACSVLMLRLKK